jgi:O-antigen/teichoic acid export membrane protein
MAGSIGKANKLVGRAGWGLSDQAFSSLTNFALSMMIARAVGPAGFGAFTLAFATYTLALAISRSLVSEPLAVRFSRSDEEGWRRSTASATGAAFALGCLAGLVILAFAAFADGTLRSSLLALGLTMPGLLLQDAWRHAFFVRRTPADAFFNDVAWAVALFPVLFFATATGRSSVMLFVLAWGGSATVAAAFGILQARVVPRPFAVVRWLREHGDLGFSFLGETMVLTGSRQGAVYAIGAIAGLAETGAIRAGFILLGPLNILYLGIRSMAVPEAIRMLDKSLTRFRSMILGMTGGLGLVALLWGGAALLIPDAWGTEILGETWGPARSLLIPLVLADAASGASTAGVIGLRALAATSHSLRARIVAALTVLVGAVGGAWLGGGEGAAWGMAGARIIGLVVYVLAFEWALRKASGPDGAPEIRAMAVGGPTVALEEGRP